MSISSPSAAASNAPRSCPSCGHDNVPNARFCARCGQALGINEATTKSDPEGETTGVFAPIGSTPRFEATWANAEAEQTAALPAAPEVWAQPESPSTVPPQKTSVATTTPTEERARGMVLGIVAVMLIAIVIGYYVYAAWLTQSVRDDILSWIP